MITYLPEDNLSYAVHIQLDSGVNGSGFFLANEDNKQVYFVTAKHVLFEKNSKLIGNNGVLAFHSDPRKLKEKIYYAKINLNEGFSNKKIIYHQTADIAIINIGYYNEQINFYNFVETLAKERICIVWATKSLFKKYKDILISNEVFILGYPTSLGKNGQIDFTFPLLRKGIVAGKNNINRTVIIDCPVYHGNSGGLVIEIDEHKEDNKLINRKFFPIGIVSELVPSKKKSMNFENSGYSVVTPLDTILDLIKS